MPISINLAFKSEQHRVIAKRLQDRMRACERSHSTRRKQWRESEDKMVGYIPETEHDAIRRGRREEGHPQYTTIMLPYSYAVAMSAHSYWSTVFLSRSPVFQYMGATGEGEDQVLAMEALTNYQLIQGRMLPSLYIWLQDVGKYGEAWVSPYWKSVKVRTSEIVEQPQTFMGVLPIPGAKPKKVKVVTETIGFQGNSIFNVAPACVFTDPRYPRNRFQDGEFVAVEITASTNKLRADPQRYINLEYIKRPNGGLKISTDIASKDAESTGLERPDITSFNSDIDEKASDVFKAYEYIIDLVPKDWGLGSGDRCEKWVFSITDDFSVIFEARPQGCLHDKFPLAYIEVEPEAYATFSRSLIEIYSPVQQALDWLVNTHFFNVRQVLNNQFILDPSRVETKDLENGKPGKAIRLKPQAYGTDIRTAIMQLPVMDVTKNNFTDIQFMYDLGDRLGVTAQMQGMEAPSSRRTAQEIRGSQTFATSRLKTIAEYMSCTGWTDLSQMIVQNSQQYYDGNLKLKIVGSLADYAGPEFLNVSPESIVGQYNWSPVDGTMPIDRFAQANLWQQTITAMAGVPQVIAQYDLGKIFGYVAQLNGLKNIDRFKVTLMPDQALLAAAASGNAVPMDATAGNPMEPGQVPLMGPTA